MRAWKKLQTIVRDDFTCLHTGTQINLITKDTLGTFCVEKIAIDAAFLGAKEYKVQSLEVESN